MKVIDFYIYEDHDIPHDKYQTTTEQKKIDLEALHDAGQSH